MQKNKVKEIEKILCRMRLPNHRKTIGSHSALKWLEKNLSVKNASHPDYEKAMDLIKEACS